MTHLVDAYAVLVGCLVFAMWGASLVTRQVPELVTAPRAIALHISAESIMGLTLIAGAAASFAGLTWGPSIVLLGLGMTLYSIVNSSGYYFQRRELQPVVMFAALFVLTAVATAVEVTGIVA
jgi:hypothetical protein